MTPHVPEDFSKSLTFNLYSLGEGPTLTTRYVETVVDSGQPLRFSKDIKRAFKFTIKDLGKQDDFDVNKYEEAKRKGKT